MVTEKADTVMMNKCTECPNIIQARFNFLNWLNWDTKYSGVERALHPIKSHPCVT
jgi:alkyl hydroperoxide reductase subunit AhpF